MPDIKDSYRLGNRGEQALIRYLVARQDAAYVCDVSADPHFQEQGIDVIFYREQQRNSRLITADSSRLEQLLQEKVRYVDAPNTSFNRYTLEIKSCALIGQTGNFFLETQSNMEKGTLGSFLYTSADYYLYYSITEELFYYMPMPKTKEWVVAQNFPERVTSTSRNGIEYYQTKGLVVPRRILLDTKQLEIKVQANPFT